MIIRELNKFDKDAQFLKWAVLLVVVACVLSVFGAAYYFHSQARIAEKEVVVIDSNNKTYIGSKEMISRDRRLGQLKYHIESFYKAFWNVTQEEEYLDKSINTALMLADESAEVMYDKFYEIDGLKKYLFENSARSYIHIEEIIIDPSTYPYKGEIFAVHEVETSYGNSYRRMDATFDLRDYPVGYDNPVGALIMKIDVYNTEKVDAELFEEQMSNKNQ